jgi:hypothetical protein
MKNESNDEYLKRLKEALKWVDSPLFKTHIQNTKIQHHMYEDVHHEVTVNRLQHLYEDLLNVVPQIKNDHRDKRNARRKLEFDLEAAKREKKLAKDSLDFAAFSLENIEDNRKVANHELRVARFVSAADERDKPFAKWSLVKIRVHRDLNEHAKWDELDEETYEELRINHGIPMVNMGIRSHPHNAQVGFAVDMGDNETVDDYRQRIKNALGWLDHPEGNNSEQPTSTPPTCNDRKRTRPEMQADLAEIQAKLDEAEDGAAEDGAAEDDEERPKKRVKL